MIVPGLAILGALAALAGHPLTLVTPQGTPATVQYQHWVTQMKVPTVTGTLMFESPTQLCVANASGCSTGAPTAWYPNDTPTTPAIAASSRWSLYNELGHQFDFRYLTNTDRGYLAWFWRVPGAAWVDSAQSISEGGENGLEGQFAYAYAICAETGNYFDSSAMMAAPTDAQPPTIRPRNPHGTCAFIDRVGRYTRS